ncbi:MAG: energy transducer TonB [Edaphobacter sp.]
MFESLVASRVGTVSAEKRWTVAASIGLQVAVAGVVMVLPLLHPEMLPFHVETPKVLMPLMTRPPVPVVAQREVSSSSAALSAAAPSELRAAMLPSLLPSLHPVAGDPPVPGPISDAMGRADGVPFEIGVGTGPAVSVRPVSVGSVRVSEGVTEGMLLAPIRPAYPAIAKAAGVQGTVVVEAIISRQGTIENLHAVSGPMMLQGAALEAIREARYRPYLLNGEPTAVQTTITVNFRMGG